MLLLPATSSKSFGFRGSKPLATGPFLNVVIGRTSKLRKLVLCGQVEWPLLTVIDLQVRKPGVELLCCDIILKYIGVAPSITDNYNSRFVELDWFAA